MKILRGHFQKTKAQRLTTLGFLFTKNNLLIFGI
jgi:hypothetical protein